MAELVNLFVSSLAIMCFIRFNFYFTEVQKVKQSADIA